MSRAIFTILVLGVACGGASAPSPEVAPSPEPAEVAEPAPETAEPAILEPEVVAAPSERDALIARLEPETRLHWRLSVEGGAQECAAVRIQPGEPTEEGYPTGWLRGSGARPSWAFVVEESRVRLHSPSWSAGISDMMSAQCETHIAFEDFPSTDEAACEARDEAFDPGPCSFFMESIARHRAWRPRHLARRLARPGRIWFTEADEDDQTQCVSWTVRPRDRSTTPSGELVRTRREGNTVHRTMLGYELSGRSLALLGPSWETRENGRVVGEGGLGCGESVLITEDEPTHADVGGNRWYFSAIACRAALDEEASGTPGGC